MPRVVKQQDSRVPMLEQKIARLVDRLKEAADTLTLAQDRLAQAEAAHVALRERLTTAEQAGVQLRNRLIAPETRVNTYHPQ